MEKLAELWIIIYDYVGKIEKKNMDFNSTAVIMWILCVCVFLEISQTVACKFLFLLRVGPTCFIYDKRLISKY